MHVVLDAGGEPWKMRALRRLTSATTQRSPSSWATSGSTNGVRSTTTRDSTAVRSGRTSSRPSGVHA
jgi:hypothetical protein